MKDSKEIRCTQHKVYVYYSDTVLYLMDKLYMYQEREKGSARRKRCKREGNKGATVHIV